MKINELSNDAWIKWCNVWINLVDDDVKTRKVKINPKFTSDVRVQDPSGEVLSKWSEILINWQVYYVYSLNVKFKRKFETKFCRLQV